MTKNKTKHPNLNVTRYNAIINNIMYVQGQYIIARGTGVCRSGRRSWYPLGIGGHSKKYGYDRVDR
jgi:hypothetical protein